MKNSLTRRICISGMVAALYAGLSLLLPALSYGPVQFRLSEALCVLPAVLPEAVPGLALGCLLANLFSPMGLNVYDAVFGTLATLLAALCTRGLRRDLWKAAVPPVICNGVIIGLVLTYGYGVPLLWTNMATVAAGEAVVCFLLGVPLARGVSRVIK